MAEPRARRKKGGPWGMIAVVAVVVIVAAFLVYSAIGKKSTGTTYTTQQVTRGTLTVAVAGNGTVVSKNQASVNPGISGTVTQLNVSVGSHVSKGDALFVIDNPQLDASVEQAKSSYQQSKASTLKAQQSELQADMSLKTGVYQAKQSLQQAQGSVADAKGELAKAQTAVPFDQNAVDSATSSLAAAQTALKTAKVNYKHACTVQKEGHAAAAESYRAAVTAQHASYLQYQQAITNADQRTVTAPIGGYITTLSINNGDQIGSSSGGTSSSSRTSSSSSSSSGSSSAPIVISSLSELQAQVQIAETDRPKVKLGQKVEITFDAVSGLTITGKVTQIDAVGTSSSGVVTYNVTISFDVQDKRLNPGMTASASIVTKVDTNVLLVPNAAVKTDTSGGSYVQVLDTPNGTPRDVTVSVGPAGDTQTEITSGLTGNENVVTQTITAGASTTRSTSGFGAIGGGAARGVTGGFRGGTSGMICIRDLCKVYHGGLGADTVALDGISLTIEDGEFVAIMGPSGSGKSTLMNILGCLDTPTSGVYELNGEDVATLDDDALADIRNLRLGFVFQSFNLLPRATVLRNVEMPMIYSTIKKADRYDRAAACLEAAGLPEQYWDHRSNELSGGQMQRVAIARALVTDPSLILADEPTGNLDTKTGEHILDTFQRLNDEGRTIILITHEPYIAEHARRIVHIQDGKILSDERNGTQHRVNEEVADETR